MEFRQKSAVLLVIFDEPAKNNTSTTGCLHVVAVMFMMACSLPSSIPGEAIPLLSTMDGTDDRNCSG
jgi:hypothetical protein